MQQYQHIIVIVVVILLIGLFAWPLLRGEPEVEAPVEEMTEEEAIDLAMEWVRNEAPTYVFDGSDLTFERIEPIENCENCFEVEVSFTSAAAGYGDRTDEMVAQVITPHTTIVTIEGGEVIRAVTDDEFVEYEIENQETEDVVDESESEDETDDQAEAEESVDNEGEASEPEAPISDTRTVQVFFGNTEEDPEAMYCDRVYSVDRQIDNVPAIASATVEKLLAGPTTDEKEAGYFSNINEGVVVEDLVIENGRAEILFNDKLEEDVGGSCLVTAIRAQIESTLKQFGTVEEVTIQVEGMDEGEVLQP